MTLPLSGTYTHTSDAQGNVSSTAATSPVLAIGE